MSSRMSGAVHHVMTLAMAGHDVTWVPLVDGKGSQSRTVGRGATISTCRRRGWLVWNPALGRNNTGLYEVTDAGRAALAIELEGDLAQRDRNARKSLMSRAHWEHGYRCHGLWTNDVEGSRRMGRVSIGPKGHWDGASYSWLIDNPLEPDGGVPLKEGIEPSLKAAKTAVERAVIALPYEAYVKG